MSGSKDPQSHRDEVQPPGGLLPSLHICSNPLPRHDQSALPDIQYSLTPAQQTPGTEPQFPPVHSTPFAKGVSSHSDETSHGIADLRPLIDEDLKYRKEISVNQFVEHILCYSLGDPIDDGVLKKLCDAKESRDLLNQFCSQAGQETIRYQPFANLANHFLNYRKPSGLTFCRNDPTLIQGSLAERKPDIVLVSTNSPQLEFGAELPRGPTVGFYWNDVYCSVEFKVKVTEAGKEADAVTSASHSLPVPSHGYGSETADLPKGSMSNEGSRKREAGGPPSRQPQAKEPDRVADHTDERPQSASYALEMLSHGRYRSHVINITIQDTSMRLWFYDRVGIIKSAAFSVTDLTLFSRVISAMGSLSPSGWGFHNFIIYDTLASVRPPPAGPRYSERQMNKPASPPLFDNESKTPRAATSPEPFAGTVIKFHNGVVVTLKEIVYRQYVLLGRGTCVIRGEVKDRSDLSGKDLMVKISWPSQWRQSEVDFLEVAGSYALNRDDEHILGHIPQVLLHQDFYSTVDGPRGKCAFENDDHRVLRVIVMESYFPVAQLHTASDFTQVIIDVVKCHRALCHGLKILHRDISMNNIMFRRGNDGRVVGVLIDFDLAVFVEVDAQYIKLHIDRRFCTGTVPFMAIDLLEENDKIHCVRHDLESFFWVIIWYTARYHEGIETTKAFQTWQKSHMAQLAQEKVYFLVTPTMYEPTEHFGRVALWVGPLLDLFGDARRARGALFWKAKFRGGQTSETLDMETLGGRITYQTFLRILEEE